MLKNPVLSSFEVVILAGGLGTRLSGVVSDRPKPMAAVNGRPFLSYLFDQLIAAGVHNAILCTGHKGEQIQEAFGESHGSLALRYSREQQALGTGGALRLALPLIRSKNVLVENGDSFCGADFNEFGSWYVSRKLRAALLLVSAPESSRYGSVNVAPDGRILSFHEKGAKAGPWINAGVYLMERDLFERIPKDRSYSLERDLFPSLIEEKALYGYSVKAAFLDIGVPEDYAAAGGFFAAQTTDGKQG